MVAERGYSNMGEETRNLATRWVCPSFSGKQEDYEVWRVKVDDWQVMVEAEVTYPAIHMRMALEGKAMETT